MAPESTQPNVLDQALAVVNGQRAQEYGDVTEMHSRIGNLWGALLGQPISAEQVALMMILLKIARASNGIGDPANISIRDSLVDIAGYALCLERIVDTRLLDTARGNG